MTTFSDFNYLKWVSSLLLLRLLLPFLLWADPNLSTTAKRAEKLFYEKLHGDALPLYSQLFAFSNEAELKTQWALRLATCYLEEEQPQTALALLSSLETPFCRDQRFFLMSLAYRQLGSSFQALHLLQQCSLPHSQHVKNLIALEKGYHLMHMGEFIQAQLAFGSITRQTTAPLPYDLAQLQLAKILLAQHRFNEALQILNLLSQPLSSQHLLNIERVYLTGWALLAQQQNSQAAACFEELLPKAFASNAPWSIQILNGLIISYLRQALTLESTQVNPLNALFSKTELVIQKLLTRAPTETSYLLLSDFYLIKAKCLSDPSSYAQAKKLLDQTELFSSPEGLRQALLKCAAAAPSYQERGQLYEQLCHPSSAYSSSFYAKAWFLKGLNDFEEGMKDQKQRKLSQNTQPFEQAIQAFSQTIQQEKEIPSVQTALALKYLALAYLHLPEVFNAQQAWKTLAQLIANDLLLSTFQQPEEIYCLSAWIALRLADKDILQQARLLLQQGQTQATSPATWKERCLKLEGLICLQLEEWHQADDIFASLLQDDLFTSSHGEAWFWRAYSAEKQQNISLKKEYLQQAYTQDPQSPYAPIAFFHFYSYREYMQGKRKAIKHLQAMPLLFPHHPLLISAYYLIGLHHKKDHFSEEGQILRRKDWTGAIDAFQLAESTFDTFFEKKGIPSADILYFTQVRYRAQLERAQANLAIAQHSSGGKKQIYLKYAEGVFKQLIEDFSQPETLARKMLVSPLSPYPKVWAEAEFQLAKAYEEKNEWEKSEWVLNTSLEHYQQAQMTHNYGLMRVWYAKGKLAQRQTNDEVALQFFLEAEKSIRESLDLSPHEKLDLWIQQSLCYKALNQLDQAMRLLSRVINDDVISPLRIKAMFLRAEIYELQGRPELAIKQLEATARKGGEWAQKAQEKLEKVYGY